MTEELTIKVICTTMDEVEGSTNIRRMIHFTGEADCKNFKGRILDGGVDTQKVHDDKAFLSARYMLEGTDLKENPCKIFIENIGGGRLGEKLITTPSVTTDSKALKYLETSVLKGTIESWEKGVIIHIFRTEGREETVKKLDSLKNWTAPEIPENIPHGDMPGDKVEIGADHIKKASLIFKNLIPMLSKKCGANEYGRAVICVAGGSGVGKSETASLMSYYLNQAGIGAYTLSGDNYPRRIPMYNDAERLRVFRVAGIRGLTKAGEMTKEHFETVQGWQQEDTDADAKHLEEAPWFCEYLREGRKALEGYLGTPYEIDFDEIGNIVEQFKTGADSIYLKRMGRTDSELWYENVDLSEVKVLVIEWTHGNSDYYKGVDIPILLNSTPEETLAHRRARNRDGKTDSAFTTMVLEIEQNMLKDQAHKAKIIVSKQGELLDFLRLTDLWEEKQ